MGVKYYFKETDYEREGWVLNPVCFTWTSPKTNKKRSKTLNLSYHCKKGEKMGASPHKLDLCIHEMVKKRLLNEGTLDIMKPVAIRTLIFSYMNDNELQDLEDRAAQRAEEVDPTLHIKELKGRMLAPPSDDSEGGVTTLIGGSSFSGKTYYLVKELNKLLVDEYDCIILMTESKNASDLKNIRKELPLVIVEGFRPDVIEKLKKINSETNNRFRFLVILDDIVDQKNSKTLLKAILTFRNCGISTCILIQYLKLISRPMRGSFHNVILTGFRSEEDYNGACEMFDLRSFVKDLISQNEQRDISSIKNYEVTKYLKIKLKDKDTVLYIDQKHSKEPIFIKEIL